jgi:hypothetical protein
MHFAVALLSQVPEALIVHLLVLGRGDETCGGFRLIDWPIAVDPGTARLPFGPGLKWLGGALGVIEALAIAEDRIRISVSPQFGM